MKLALSEQLQHSTIRIETTLKSGSQATGTGFFFHFLEKENGEFTPVIITNKHVIKDALTGVLRFTIKTQDNLPDYSKIKEFTIPNFESYWINHPDPNVDLCAMPFAGLMQMANSEGIRLFYISFNKSFIMSDEELEQLMAIEDITMVGYPNGIWDAVNNTPIMRRGITATHPKLNYNGKDEFLIDAACFPGSSGSPVFLFNEGMFTTRTVFETGVRFKLLGVLYAGPQHTATGSIEIVNIPTVNQPIAVSRIPNNLGVIIKAKKIIELELEVQRILSQIR